MAAVVNVSTIARDLFGPHAIPWQHLPPPFVGLNLLSERARLRPSEFSMCKPCSFHQGTIGLCPIYRSDILAVHNFITATSCLTSRRQYVTSITRMFSCSRVRGGKTLCLPRRSWGEAKRRELSSSPATTATNTNEGRRPPHVA